MVLLMIKYGRLVQCDDYRTGQFEQVLKGRNGLWDSFSSGASGPGVSSRFCGVLSRQLS